MLAYMLAFSWMRMCVLTIGVYIHGGYGIGCNNLVQGGLEVGVGDGFEKVGVRYRCMTP